MQWCITDPICTAGLAGVYGAAAAALRRYDSLARLSPRRRWRCGAAWRHCCVGAGLSGLTSFSLALVGSHVAPGYPLLLLGIVILLALGVDLTQASGRQLIRQGLVAWLRHALRLIDDEPPRPKGGPRS